MYVKILSPQRHGRVVYNNAGSAQRTVNYLSKEAKEAGAAAVFFGSEGSGELSGEQVVARLDGNRKGLTKEEARFHSLVLSPSQEEVARMGNDPQALQRYTRNVMELYAQNFQLKNGRQLHETDLVWAATIHQERKHRGADSGEQGTAKPGLQTHVHVIVSARDAGQKITLNPQGKAARFNRVQFQAQANVQLEMEASGEQLPAAARTQRVAQKAAEIREGAAASRVRQPRTPAQLAAKDARLDVQVARVNSKLYPAPLLDAEQVKAVARERDYDNDFYTRLGQIERRAERGQHTPQQLEYLRTGELQGVAGITPGQQPIPAEMPSPRPAQLAERPPVFAAALESTLTRISREIAPKSRTQDVRSEEEKRRDYEQEL